MIRVFSGTDTNYATNGEVIIHPYSCTITCNTEEEYLELECPLKYVDFLIQDNVIVVNTPTGKRGYRIHNPSKEVHQITIKAINCYRENIPISQDRGVTVKHGKNLDTCVLSETWDDVVTKLTPIGYEGLKLPEGHISIISPYPREYEKTIEFELSEELEETIEDLEEELGIRKSLLASLENSILVLQAKTTSFDKVISELEVEKQGLQQRLGQLGASEAELKEKEIILAQIPLVNSDIVSYMVEKDSTQMLIRETQVNFENGRLGLNTAQENYKTVLENDLRTQARAYIDLNQSPKISYEMSALLKGVVEVGDTIKVEHPLMKINLLTNVRSYQYNCLAKRYEQILFGNQEITLKGKFAEIEEKIEGQSSKTDKLNEKVIKYSSEYKRDDRELLSKFVTEVYGVNGSVYGLLEKNQSIFRQTASTITASVIRDKADLSKQIAYLTITADEISMSVSNVRADLSSDIAQLSITAQAIKSTVESNYTDLNGKINYASSSITQTASEIRSEVNTKFTSYSTTTQMNSAITQKADSITSTVNTKFNSYSTTTQMTSAINQKADSITSTVDTKFTNYSTTTQMNSAIEQKATSITSTVTAQITGVSTQVSQVKQTADKIEWLVKSGTSSSNFTLTDRAISLVASTIDLSGLVTISNLSTSGKTIINGGNITTGTIDASKATIANINASSITTGTLDASKITVTNLNATSITSGKLDIALLYIGEYKVMSQGSYSNSVQIGGSYYNAVNTVTIAGTTFNTATTYTRLCSNGGYLGFFGNTGSTKQSVATLTTSATLAQNVTKTNEIINALKAYGVM